MNTAGTPRQRFTGHCLITGGRLPTMCNNRPCFVWRFVSDQNAVTYTTTAASEREARLQLPAVRLVFVARIRMEVQSHA
ncbi:host cell division inhibitor Icd-like protein [Salmonella enterica]